MPRERRAITRGNVDAGQVGGSCSTKKARATGFGGRSKDKRDGGGELAVRRATRFIPSY